MKAKLKKTIAMIIATIMCVNTMCVEAQAATLWNGDKVFVDVTAGEKGYTFRSVYQKPYHAYEMSNHMVTVDDIGYDIPQTLVMIEANRDYRWTPNGLYSLGVSNYETLYCCDAETGYNDAVYYKRTNLEDSDYYDVEKASHIRGIVTNSYPYVSLEQMKKNLVNEGFAYAEKLTRAEIITAVQAAIWAYANEEVGEYKYGRTFDVSSNSQWGGVMHDYTSEMDVWWNTGKRKFSTNDEVANRINSLISHLKNYTVAYAEKNQIVISDIDIMDSTLLEEKNGVYTVNVNVDLNNSGSSLEDDIRLNVYVGDTLCTSQDIVLGKESYDVTVNAMAGEKIKAVVEGTQVLPNGVYFYEPKGGRDVSQSLVGVAAGPTDVYAEAEVDIHSLTFKKGTVSNISYMLVDSEGKVEFLYKEDVESGSTFAPIEAKEEYISAMFMKQANSGMVWVSEEVSDEVLANIIASIKANNPSYKGYDAVAFGFGDHILEYKNGGKKTKTVTYTFK
ncbi:MAG: hypothetical protein E7262_11050 [Lachnospiraceae bacterium]|nr:hypothetical protein [Lachnospiraceae bacterium]